MFPISLFSFRKHTKATAQCECFVTSKPVSENEDFRNAISLSLHKVVAYRLLKQPLKTVAVPGVHLLKLWHNYHQETKVQHGRIAIAPKSKSKSTFESFRTSHTESRHAVSASVAFFCRGSQFPVSNKIEAHVNSAQRGSLAREPSVPGASCEWTRVEQLP